MFQNKNPLLKKIYAISQVKNEADIIESFIRYSLIHFDGIIITDDASTDNTLEIIHSLSVEFSERVIIIPSRKKGDAECRLDYHRNKLLQIAFDEYNADIVVPLDADEFLIADDEKTVRLCLEKLDENACYLCRWKTFIYSPYDGDMLDCSFVPARYLYYRNPHMIHEMTKVIVFRKPWLNANLSLVLGNHTVISISKRSFPLIELENLFFAHYPIRSVEQIKSKVIKFMLHNLSVPDMNPKQSNHIEMMYNYLKKHNLTLSNNDILWFNLLYSSSESHVPEKTSMLSNCIAINPQKYYPEIKCIHTAQMLNNISVITDTVASVMSSYDKLYPNNNNNKGVTTLLDVAEFVVLDYREKRRELLDPNEKLRIKYKWIMHNIWLKPLCIIQKSFPNGSKRGKVVRHVWYKLNNQKK